MACILTAGITACATTSTLTRILTSLIVTTFQTTVTTTQQIISTLKATPGETLTISPPPSSWHINPSTTQIVASTTTIPDPAVLTTLTNVTPVYSTYTTSSTEVIPAPTVIITEFVLILQDTNGNTYTTSTLTVPVATTTYASQVPATPLTVVVDHHQGSGWHTWTDAEKGGIIAGPVLAFLILLSTLLCWLMKRRQIWIANDWTVNSHPGAVSSHSTYGYGHRYMYPWIRGGGGNGGGSETLQQ